MAGFITEGLRKGAVRIGVNRGKSQVIKIDGKGGTPLSIASLFKDQLAEEIDMRMQFLGETMISFLQGDTPVDTGFARANWQISVAKRSYAQGHNQRLIYKEIYDRVRTLSKAKRANTIPLPPRYMIGLTRLDTFSSKNGDVALIITNNVPYMRKLDSGSSKQAPKNFIQKAIMLAREEVKNL